MKTEVRNAAIHLAEMNAGAEPAIEEIYLFPSDEEIRLIEVDSTAIPSEEITPFYFDPSPEDGVPFPMGIAMIRPAERKLKPPSSWGSWDVAEKIWPRKNGDGR